MSIERDDKFVRNMAKIYETILSLRKDDDYVVNQPQMDKLVEVIDFFLNTADGEVDPVELHPKEICGGVTASFVVFDVTGDDIQTLSKIISYLSAITIDPTADDRVCISVTIPKVFVKKSQ